MISGRVWPSRLLLIDAGNSRLKFKFVDECSVAELREDFISGGPGMQQSSVERIVAAKPVSIPNVDLLEAGGASSCTAIGILRNFLHDASCLVLISSVAQRSVIAWLKAQTSVSLAVVEEARVHQEALGITMRYDRISTLGVDRWLAMLGAFRRSPRALCVVDCGTAITVDFLSKEGVHEGGLIAPGFATCLASLNMADSLKEAVQAVAFAQAERLEQGMANRHERLGLSSAACIFHGVDRMALAFLDTVFSQVLQQSSEREIYVTGGGWPSLAYEPVVDYRYVQDLVFEGLVHAWLAGLTRPF